MDREQKEALLRNRHWAPSPEDENTLARGETNDPALAKLREQQGNFNARVHQELAAIPVPTTLRDQILARRKTVRVSHWGAAQSFLAIAAAVLVLGVGLFFWMRPREDTTIAGFRSRMANYVIRQYTMDVTTNDLRALRRFLAQKGDPANFSLPPRLATLPLKGGAAMSWQGKGVSMVCFDSPAKKTLYMFVLDQSFPSAVGVQPQTVKGLNTVIWTTDGKTFLLAGEVPETDLTELVKS